MQIPGDGDNSKIVMHELIANNKSTDEYYIAIEEMIPTCKWPGGMVSLIKEIL